MKLTAKDKDFLHRLRRLLDERQLAIELKDDGLKHFCLRQNYGDHIEGQFGVTRQGVRWRFNHIFNEAYVQALMAVLMIEAEFGSELRQKALAIAKEQIELWQKARKATEITLPRRETVIEDADGTNPESQRDSPS